MPQELKTIKETKAHQKIVRVFFFVVGTISLVLGGIGIVLPLLPTTPFLLLSLACYLRSSTRMTHWILNNKYFGKYIRNYKEGKGIPLKTKIFAIIVLWISIVISAIFIINILIVQIILFAIASGVTIHLIRLPTYRN
ncbi:MAG: YbaN family protein [Candidatus Bathyarchaeota archaeon]